MKNEEYLESKIDLMIDNKIVTRQELNNGANLKKMKLMKWSNLI